MAADRDTLGAIVEANAYMTLATADGDGNPWATPVWFAHVGAHEFLWVSRPEARHSRNLAARPRVGIVVFDSTVRPARGRACTSRRSPREVPAGGPRRRRWRPTRSARSPSGLRPWTEADVTAPAQHRLYRALAERRFAARRRPTAGSRSPQGATGAAAIDSLLSSFQE